MNIEQSLEKITNALETLITLIEPSINDSAKESIPVVETTKKTSSKTANKTSKKKTETKPQEKTELDSDIIAPQCDEDTIRTLGKNINLKYPKGVGMKKVQEVLTTNGSPNHKIFELKKETYAKVVQELEAILVGQDSKEDDDWV